MPAPAAAAVATPPETPAYLPRTRIAPVPGHPGVWQMRTELEPVEGGRALTTWQAAQMLGLSPRTVRRLCERGTLRSHIPGERDRRIVLRDLMAYQQRRGIPLTPVPLC